jgi:fluoride exporter
MIAAQWKSGRAYPAASLYFAVALGSALGGTARWLISAGMLAWCGPGFPWGTLFVNVTGSLLIGFYAALVAPGGRLLAGPRQRHFVITGICGGYTTFSIFGLESIALAQAGQLGPAGLNVLLSASAWLVAVWAGFALGTRMNRLRRA